MNILVFMKLYGDGFDQLLSQLCFGSPMEFNRPGSSEQGEGIVISTDTGSGLTDPIGSDHMDVFGMEFCSGMGKQFFSLSGKADREWRFFQASHRSQNVGITNQLQRQGRAIFFDFLLGI